MDTLPSAKEITRADFAGEKFDVEAFLVEHCQFQSLSDLRQAVARWEVRLKGELEATVNDNYSDLAGSGQHLTEARDALAGVRLEVLQFKAQIARMARTLASQQATIGAEIARDRANATALHKANALLAFVSSLDRIERLPLRLSDQQLVELGLTVEELLAVRDAHPTAQLVSENLHRVQQAREDALRRMADRVRDGGSFDVVLARARLCD